LFGTTSSEAVTAYVAAVQAAIRCISGEIVRATGYRSDDPSQALVLARGVTASLVGGTMPLGLELRQFYRLVEDQVAPRRLRWHVELTGYHYAFFVRRSGQELLAFHWHPHIVEKSFPHVHLESGLGLLRDFVGVHVPTGPLDLEDVIRFAIEELGVRPRVRSWAAVLEQTRAARRA
jgi:hypothetical protein